MYNQSYDDYIRSVLGYPNVHSQDYFPNYNEADMYDYGQNRNDELEDCYPEIYKIVYPMVQKRCQNIETPITREKIDILVEELYSNIEENRQTENRQTENKKTVNSTTGNREIKETRETRQFNNSGIMDIIRILLLRELLGRPNRPGNRPPFPPPPPGRPPFPPNRPGRPLYYREYGDIYEY